MRKIITALMAVLLTAACAGRDPAPMMPVMMGNEQSLSCPAIYAEMNANNVRIA